MPSRPTPALAAARPVPDATTPHAAASDAPLQDELARLRAEVEALREEQRTFAQGISHDLRAPLRAIDTFAALVEKDPALGEVARSHLGRVRAAAGRMGGLLDGLLELSRAGRVALEPRPVDLGLLAEWAVAELQEAEPTREARIDIAPGLDVVGDERLLKVLLAQLLGNAWKFSRDRDHVCIVVGGERAGDRLHVSVRDTGCGFEMAYADKLFQPFQRLAGSEQGAGHGLGLAIARRIVARHGGTLRAESEPGVGSCFRFDLAVAPAS